MPAEVQIRALHSMQDLLATVDLQKAVWRMVDHECTSPHTMKAATITGGCVLGAELDGAIVGFCFGIAAKRDADIWLWSHMAAVHPASQGRGIGMALKRKQREWALKNGYRVMAWTFDPLQSGNANFNFNRLGAKARRYYVNHYGAMEDGINAGLASDRLEAQWQLDDPGVAALAKGEALPPESALDAVKLVFVDSEGLPIRLTPDRLDQPRYAVQIPRSIAELKQSDLPRAQTWQIHARQAITDLLKAGYFISGFTRDAGRCWYVLTRVP